MKPYFKQSGVVIYHGDCREIIPALPKCSAVITDPPYGIGFTDRLTDCQRRKGITTTAWDDESGNIDGLIILAPIVVIWGGNYFPLPKSRGWLSWFKPDAPPSMGHFELAWTNLDRNARQISHSISATNPERVGHPTQKPLAVMKWTITQVGIPASIIDPYMGSGTTLRAAKDFGIPAIGIEIEEQYCEMAAKRLAQNVLEFSGGTE